MRKRRLSQQLLEFTDWPISSSNYKASSVADPDASLRGVNSSIFACADALEKIQNRLGAPNCETQSGIRAGLHNFKVRLCYPFKQEDTVY